MYIIENSVEDVWSCVKKLKKAFQPITKTVHIMVTIILYLTLIYGLFSFFFIVTSKYIPIMIFKQADDIPTLSIKIRKFLLKL